MRKSSPEATAVPDSRTANTPRRLPRRTANRRRRLNSEATAPSDDPLDDPGYQQFLAETAKGCKSRSAPCPGCCAGGMCDDWDGAEEREDEREPCDEDDDDEP